MTWRAGNLPPVVITASPGGRPFGRRARRALHSSRMSGPPAPWIAPSTPPPPMRLEFAALTIASTCSCVRSPCASSSRALPRLRASEGGTVKRRRREEALATSSRARPLARERPLLGPECGVLGRLGHHELQPLAGRDLDRLAR